MAAREIGINVVAAVENDQHACATYRANFQREGDSPPMLFENDIMDLSITDFMMRAKLEKGCVDLLMGGPPCQGFSTHRLKNAGVHDPRNLLLLRYFEYVSALCPKVFLVENVTGLLWPRHGDYLKDFYAAAAAAGYTVCPPVVLDARDYDVPQRRKRVFILGWLGKMPSPVEWPPPPMRCSPDEPRLAEEGLEPWRVAKEVFIQPLKVEDPNAVHLNHTQTLIEVFRSTPPNGGSRHQSCRVLPCHRFHSGHKDVYGRINPDVPGPTMTTACINPSKGRFLHPTEHHGITVRHAARFQTFPDWFVFHGGLMASAVQVGNAVPIQLGKAVLTSVVKAMQEILPQ